MKTSRIRIICVDVVKVDLPRELAFLAYDLRSSAGDNHSATDIAITTPQRMCEELYEAARNKASLLDELLGGWNPDAAKYQVADFKVTHEKLTPLLQRLQKAVLRYRAGQLTDAEQALLETDGVHLLRPDLDLEGHTADERAAILIKRASRHLEQMDADPARLMAQRALRLRPHDTVAQDLLARCDAAKSEP